MHLYPIYEYDRVENENGSVDIWDWNEDLEYWIEYIVYEYINQNMNIWLYSYWKNEWGMEWSETGSIDWSLDLIEMEHWIVFEY